MMAMPWNILRAGKIPVLFMHIQKTAGTSIINLARHFYQDSVISHGDYCSRRPDELADTLFVSGHFGYAYARHLMQRRYSFTFLRDPVERVLSFYYFCKSRDPDQFPIYRLAQSHDLVGFISACIADPFYRMLLWNNQTWQFAFGDTHLEPHPEGGFSSDQLLSLAKQHLDEFSYVGFTESFATDAYKICRALGFPPRALRKELPLANANATPMRKGLAEQPAKVRELLLQITELDRDLYDHARRAAAAKQMNWWRKGW
jgi:hypothetical protein